MKTKRVVDLMTRDVAVINRKSDVHELEKRVHGLPVVVDDSLRVRGVISALDILHAIPGVEELVKPETDVRAVT